MSKGVMLKKRVHEVDLRGSSSSYYPEEAELKRRKL